MGKKELKSKIREAIEKGPLKESIEKLFLFGSQASGRANGQSDVDLLIEFKPDATIGFFAMCDLMEYMEKALGMKIDLLTPDGISPYFRKNIMDHADLVYEK